jgi:hypothetical protein
VEIFMLMFSRRRLGVILFHYARKLVVARSFSREFIVFGSAMAACRRTADGLLPLSA